MIIDDLWNGNINPCESFVKGNEEYSQAIKELIKAESVAEGLRNEDITAMMDAQHHLSYIAEKCAFASGVRFGVKLMVEVLCS